MLTQYEKFKDILREMFQMDKSDLDFGIYRILNARRDEIEKFLDTDLLPQVKEEFTKYRGTEIEEKKKELAGLESTLRDSGMNPDDSPKVQGIREAISKYGDDEALTNEVFSHLTSFFRRYYDNGDFMSLRRYKKDTYAIPYEGEEVKLHWANADQYYIKTSEFLKDYTFKLSGGKRAHFKLIEATQEKDNIKTATGKERRFMLYDEEPVRIEGEDVYIQFVYLPDKEKQETHNKKTIEFISSEVGKSLKGFPELYAPAPTAKNTGRTIWEKHLNSYTARFNFDFFIHKDLGGFLRRELDFYIKNEVLFVDDLDANDEKQLKSTVAKIKVIKHIGQKIILFLAQLEDFQKKLWLKKKFVINCGYCVTLDRVPESLYSEIVKNEAQREEWVKLFAIDEIEANLIKPGYSKPLTVEFLKANPYLVLDTKHFSNEFKDRLLASFENLDEATDGLIINSENFQALNLLSEKYHDKVKCIYIDPPYNTGGDDFIYKDTYQHASWLSMMKDRLTISRDIILQKSAIFISLGDKDENYRESHRLITLMDMVFGSDNYLQQAIWKRHAGGGNDSKFFAVDHEYLCVYSKSRKDLGQLRLPLSSADKAKYTERDEYYDILGPHKLKSFKRMRPDDPRENLKYKIKTPDGSYLYDEWKWEEKKYLLKKQENKITIRKDTKGNWQVEYKLYLYDGNDEDEQEEKTKVPRSLLIDIERNSEGKKQLKTFFMNEVFSNPKPIGLINFALSTCSPIGNEIILDYFAGSGTTAHSVINLNREDAGTRKYILVEMGNYFDTVLKPRIQKVVYSKDWKDGKPVSREGSSHMFKYMSLESYDDTLDNLQVARTKVQDSLLSIMNRNAREEYRLSYMLDIETSASDSLLNIDRFSDPFNYTLKIRKDNELRDEKIDLVETFNYLIGLYVQQTETIRGFKVVKGRLRTGEKTLVIWRNVDEKPNEVLDNFFLKQDYRARYDEFDLIFVNGDNNLENLKIGEEKWKVRLIEEEFKKRMFEN